MKVDYSQAEFMFLFLGITAILSYPPPLPNYQLPIVAISSRDDRGRGVVRRLATCRGCIRWIAHGVGKTQPDKFVVDEGIAQENVA